MQTGIKLNLDDLNKMYVLSRRRVVVKPRKDGGSATFPTTRVRRDLVTPRTPPKSLNEQHWEEARRVRQTRKLLS